MLFLTLETSSPQASLALFRKREMLSEDVMDEEFTSVRGIAVRIRSLLSVAGYAVRDLQGIAVSVGPGSYTGVRVGVTAAKSLGFALQIPVAGVQSLRVLAANVALADRASEPSSEARGTELVATILDGRQSFLYGSLYEVTPGQELPRRLRELLPQTVDTDIDLCATIARRIEEAGGAGRPVQVIGDGADAFLELAASRVPRLSFVAGAKDLSAPRARAAGLLAEPELAGSRWNREAVHRLEPLYLRVTEAERRLMDARRG